MGKWEQSQTLPNYLTYLPDNAALPETYFFPPQNGRGITNTTEIEV